MTKKKPTFKKKTDSPNSIGKKSAKKEQSASQKANHFKAGNSLGGRPKGSRNKFAEHFIADFLADWEDNGAAAIVSARTLDPVAYVKVAASLLPKQLDFKTDQAAIDRMLEKLDESGLDNLIRGLTAIGASTESADNKAAKPPRSKSDSLH